MRTSGSLLFFITSAILTVLGIFYVDRSENLGVTTLFFVASAMFLYSAFSKVKMGITIPEIQEMSKFMVYGEDHKASGKTNTLWVGILTFLVILSFFALGFGVGKLIYHILN